MDGQATATETTAVFTPDEAKELRFALPLLSSPAANKLADLLGVPLPYQVAITRYLRPCSNDSSCVSVEARCGEHTTPLAAMLLLRAGFAERTGDTSASRFHLGAINGKRHAAAVLADAEAMLTACKIDYTVADAPLCRHL